MTSGSTHLWSRFGAALLVGAAWVPVALPGGGDNDSPYNLPKANPYSAPVPAMSPASQSAVGVTVKGAGTLFDSAYDPKQAWISVPQGVLLDPAGSGDEPVVPQVAVCVPAGESLLVARNDSASTMFLRGTFAVTTEQPLLLQPTQLHGARYAILAIGTADATGPGLATVDQVVTFLVPPEGLDLTKLGNQVAKSGAFAGKAFELTLVEVAYHVDQRGPTPGVAAKVFREVGSPTQFVELD